MDHIVTLRAKFSETVKCLLSTYKIEFFHQRWEGIRRYSFKYVFESFLSSSPSGIPIMHTAVSWGYLPGL